ncbi:MAG TPA: condensation domain-containing protein [Candidatus Kapabacteria bacterium]|nr:condensation domain-containing protein [Candidatus Kapabacteria bacterium]
MSMQTGMGDRFAASPQQQHGWALFGAAATNLLRSHCIVEIDGPLDRDRLGAALRTVVGRHEALRTRLVVPDGWNVPVQLIETNVDAGIRIIDGSTIDDADLDGSLDALLDAMYADGALHLCLVSRLPQQHLLLASIAALYADAASLAIFLSEIACAYAGEVFGEVTQYADVAAWYSDLIENDESATERYHWDDSVSPATLAAQLPFARSDRSDAFAAERVPVDLPTPSLRALASSLGATLDDLLLATWMLLIRRHAGESDIAVGALFDGRPYEEMARGIGPYASVLPIRCTVPDHASFADLMHAVARERRQCAGCQEYFT